MEAIVIADDSAEIREYFLLKLQSLNYQIHSASDGKELIDLCLQHHPDLVITDYRMPVCDGLVAVKKIKQYPQFKRLPVILISSYPFSKNDASLFSDLGVINFFLKPFEFNEVIDAVQLELNKEHRMSSTAVVPNLRASKRYETEFYVHLHPEEERVRVKNISKNGLCIVLNHQKSRGELLTIKMSECIKDLDPQWQKLHTSTAKVVWSKPCQRIDGLFLTGVQLF